ncbi:MAG: glycosyltransferase [Solirubrobacterales bacterium]|nr:glycosyltransferase [Solirubrobacterales bacterium]
MSRPEVSVVMPFAGDAAAARGAVRMLLGLSTEPGDELILADNSGVAGASLPIIVVQATAEHSAAHARNVGAEHAGNEWILFLDADCIPTRNLLDLFFCREIARDVGALAGEVRPAPGGETVAARYGAARSFLSQEAHLAHPYRPRAVAANLLVRRAAFEHIGGFYEGVRAAEDTDFSWRLQQAGWRIELRPEAAVEHRYRTTVKDLRRQWRGYAAGRAWLARRYEGFEPEPAVSRGTARVWRRLSRQPARVRPGRPADPGRSERVRYLALDALLSAEELAGFTLSNRPSIRRRERSDVVLIAERFPALGDPLVEFAGTLDGARIEAAARPEALDVQLARSLSIDYREDDGAAARLRSLAALTVRHPFRSARDLTARRRAEPGLAALAPAVRRLQRDAGARVHVLGGPDARATAMRIARLAGRPLEEEARDTGPRTLHLRRR